MVILNDTILKNLALARKRKGLSQRALSLKSGVPQGHISRIENGDVDLRTSSLIALARVLDLELALLPKASLPAVQAIVRGHEGGQGESLRPAYHLDEEGDE